MDVDAQEFSAAVRVRLVLEVFGIVVVGRRERIC